MTSRFLIGKGEILTQAIPHPKKRSSKDYPYTLAEAKSRLLPKILKTIDDLNALPKIACPHDIAVAKIDLHPAFIAKSFFPTSLFKENQLTSVGSHTILITPEKEVRKKASATSETTRLFVAGTRAAFSGLLSFVETLDDPTSQTAIAFCEIENISSMTRNDRLRPIENSLTDVYEVGLHIVDPDLADTIHKAFVSYAEIFGFTVNDQYRFSAGRMLFLAVEGKSEQLDNLADFTLVRVIRPMPLLRATRPIIRGIPTASAFHLPSHPPLSDEPRVAILDGGLPEENILSPYIKRYEKSDISADNVEPWLAHGLGVTSAFLFGSITPDKEAARPYSYVDHFRVLDSKTPSEDPYELYRTLAHIEEILISRQYTFINLSLGPELPCEDNDVHAWTAVLDSHLSDGKTVMTIAAGNNGMSDRILGLDRIQVPGDSINAITVGAANSAAVLWDRANYSARGHGRPSARIKPDLLAFGGTSNEPFHVAAPGKNPQLLANGGTSFAAPLALRTAAGIQAILGKDVEPLTIKALMIHAAETSLEADRTDIGWGRIPEDINAIIMCRDNMARIIYQGSLYPKKHLRALIPLPRSPLNGDILLSATFCFASPVDIEDAATYARAGLNITFRPHADQRSGKQKQAKTGTFFPSSKYRTEEEQRNDLGKWETVLHSTQTFSGADLKSPVFDIHYNAREGGADTRNAAPIPYALVVSIDASRHADLYDNILAEHRVLQPIEPRISLPVRI